MTINIEALLADLNSVNFGIRQHKKIISLPHDEHTRWVQSGLVELKSVATTLYMLRASLRGRVHRKGDTLEEQEKYLLDHSDRWFKFIEKEAAA